MRNTEQRSYEARDINFQIWDCPKEGTLRVPTRVIRVQPLQH
jgi:hypothetical protein